MFNTNIGGVISGDRNKEVHSSLPAPIVAATAVRERSGGNIEACSPLQADQAPLFDVPLSVISQSNAQQPRSCLPLKMVLSEVACREDKDIPSSEIQHVADPIENSLLDSILQMDKQKLRSLDGFSPPLTKKSRNNKYKNNTPSSQLLDEMHRKYQIFYGSNSQLSMKKCNKYGVDALQTDKRNDFELYATNSTQWELNKQCTTSQKQDKTNKKITDPYSVLIQSQYAINNEKEHEPVDLYTNPQTMKQNSLHMDMNHKQVDPYSTPSMKLRFKRLYGSGEFSGKRKPTQTINMEKIPELNNDTYVTNHISKDQSVLYKHGTTVALNDDKIWLYSNEKEIICGEDSSKSFLPKQKLNSYDDSSSCETSITTSESFIHFLRKENQKEHRNDETNHESSGSDDDSNMSSDIVHSFNPPSINYNASTDTEFIWKPVSHTGEILYGSGTSDEEEDSEDNTNSNEISIISKSQFFLNDIHIKPTLRPVNNQISMNVKHDASKQT